MTSVVVLFAYPVKLNISTIDLDKEGRYVNSAKEIVWLF